MYLAIRCQFKSRLRSCKSDCPLFNITKEMNRDGKHLESSWSLMWTFLETHFIDSQSRFFYLYFFSYYIWFLNFCFLCLVIKFLILISCADLKTCWFDRFNYIFKAVIFYWAKAENVCIIIPKLNLNSGFHTASVHIDPGRDW